MSELSEAELDALVAQATVDCYNEDEELAGFAVVIEDNLALPFETTVLRITLTVRKTVQTESGIVAICVRGKHRQAIPILDLPLPDPPPRGAEWIAVLGLTALGNMFIELCADCTGSPSTPSSGTPRLWRTTTRPANRSGDVGGLPTWRTWPPWW